MNIFYLSRKPSRCARWHCDKHVVKMILETAQLLYTAHWVLSELEGGRPDLGDAPLRAAGERGYLSIRNKKHPCAIWTRASLQHYDWLCELGFALCMEFRHRYGKVHSCEKHLEWLYINPPVQLEDNGWTQPPQAMPDEFKRSRDSIVAYRIYYVESKGARGLLTYTKRHRPHWVPAPVAATAAKRA